LGKSLDISEIKYFNDVKEQYIHPKINYEKIDGNILDIGAYDGDSMKTFYNNCPNVLKIYAIEPQSNNFEALKNNINKLNYSNKVIPIKYAISNVDDEKVFIDVQESLSSTAQVNAQGENENFIFTKTLDSLYRNEKIDLIKMDIEGFEMNALLGAKEIIKNQTPTLILSAYHKNKDIYDFIDFIESLSKEYKLFSYHHPLTYHEIEYYFINKKLYKD
jgi:FkbM family methyltransferase